MNETTQQSRKRKSPPIFWWSAGMSVILLAMLTWVYYAEPLNELASEYWNDKVVDALNLIAAVAAAALSAMFARQFGTGERPRRIWLAFSIGWWCWVAGELSGFIYDLYYYESGYPDLTLIDLCWSLGYFFFGLSLYYQFRLIYGSTQKRRTIIYFLLLGLGLIVTLGLTQLALQFGLGEGIGWFALYLAVLYPVFDLAEGSAAIWLSFLFGRGQWGRPWWGLIAFAVADGINIYFWIGGYERLPENTALILDVFSTTMYAAGYLVTALALLSNYLMMRHVTVRTQKLQPDTA